MERVKGTDEKQENEQGCDVERTGYNQHGGIAKAVIEEVSRELAEDNPSHSATQTDQPGNGANHRFGEEIGGQYHDERGPPLVAKEAEAEQGDALRACLKSAETKENSRITLTLGGGRSVHH